MKGLVKSLTLAVATLAFLPTYAASATTFTPAQKTQIEEIVHQYLLKKPEVIIEVMQILQRKQYEQAQQTVKQTQQNSSKFINALFHQANDPVAGNPNGSITVVEFFDYQCPHCVDMAPVMDSIIKANPDVRVVYKEFPIRGPQSEFAARAALAANLQGKYVEFSHALLTAGQPFTDKNIYAIAEKTGLNLDKLKKDMASSLVSNALKTNMTLGKNDLKLLGTPAFFIGRTNAKDSNDVNYIPGQLDQGQLQNAIDTAKK